MSNRSNPHNLKAIILNMVHANKISEKLNIGVAKVKATIKLLDDGNTLAFIARYRKEVTGNLDEEQISHIIESLKRHRNLDIRRKTVISTIKDQGKLTTKLESQILNAESNATLEDLYQPYKPKRKTKASVAQKNGLQDLADLIIIQVKTDKSLSQITAPFLNEEVKSENMAWEGARYIVAEAISDHAGIRQQLREKANKWAILQATQIKKAIDERGVFKNYYDFDYKVNKIRPHQILAINRGEKSKILRVKIKINEHDWQGAIRSYFKVDSKSPLASQLEESIIDSAERLLLPAISRDIRRNLKEIAENHAIGIFAKNLRGLLSQSPLSGHTILGLDPGYRTGCKIAVIDPSGKVLDIATIYPHKPQDHKLDSIKILSKLVDKHGITLITIGNGTASRESEELIATLIQKKYPNLKYLIVSEAGASVYSASKLARAEFPDMDVSIRGAVSIARRVQDPLSELVKIDPKSIGVGLYQHDVDQKKMTESLDTVVASVVNQVGVDLGTASVALLTHISGIGAKLAERIVAYRDKNGKFPDRKSMKEVPGLGMKAYEQAAGFIRIIDGKNPLDASAIHPESYKIAEAILKKAGFNMNTSHQDRKQKMDKFIQVNDIEKLAADFEIGKTTLLDLFEQLIRPGRDPRKDGAKPILRSDILSMKDLLPGIILKGTVRNVVDFGAFIDIGVKQDGLLHFSQIPKSENLQVGNILDVEIEKVDPERGRISLLWIDKG